METKTKLCSHCKEEINSLATKCPKCQGDLKSFMHKPIGCGSVIVIVLIIIIFSSIFSSDNKPKTETTNIAPVDTISKEKAQKELKDFMETAKQAKIISSYEFSDTENVVYVDSMWYAQKVDFKKDIIAKIGLLKKVLTGYTHFEARDSYSNEKVAEITAFSQSVEIYK